MRRLKIAIVDSFCPRPYDGQTWEHEAMGGTELTASRIAEMLASHHDMAVLQHCRTETVISANGTRYEPGGQWRRMAAERRFDVVIIINSVKLLALWRKHAQTDTRLILWRHNFIGKAHRHTGQLLENADASMLCVSHYHRRHTLEMLGLVEASRIARRIGVVYNPVITVSDGTKEPVAPAVDTNQLLFASSPHKGLHQVLKNFSLLKESIPQLSLIVCTPGYLERTLPACAGVHYMGKLRPAEVHAHMRRSLCLFNAQSEFAETFGLVFAEAHSVGTPVIAQRGLGSVNEVVGDAQGQALDVNDVAQVHASIARWRAGQRPCVALNAAFAANVVKSDWMRLLNADEIRHNVCWHKTESSSYDL
ncbi:hypothetical protein W822_05645 [Advenella kashmirensis W13003]|uniref:Glycosyl transferase family 1 domain-containing protein n=1 Tax=Advenella kashmirensis W13003 TaxID=1424334 RepID=V8QWA3_9BURK|nr:glycosyltransferase family 4 protein [Advenella kashmirensis]ETF03618.1 hypothetical protein W822_05645 [Advenella kashmirensis W13003]